MLSLEFHPICLESLHNRSFNLHLIFSSDMSGHSWRNGRWVGQKLICTETEVPLRENVA